MPTTLKQPVFSSGYGWPLVPGKEFPGECVLACGKCGSQDITLTTRYGFPGSGPKGRPRLGDPGAQAVAICNHCGAQTTGS